MRSHYFKPAKKVSDFKKRISDCFESEILNFEEPDSCAKISFIHNQVRANYRNGSLQRSLLTSSLVKSKSLFHDASKIIDVAGEGALHEVLMVPKDKCDTLNIALSNLPTYVEDAEGDCLSVPSASYDAAFCINYMLLAENPLKVVRNIYRFLKKEGIAVIDFISLTYWYIAPDGRHYHSYNPSRIKQLIEPFFPEFVIVPIGNWFQGACNFYMKRFGDNRVLKNLFKFAGEKIGRFDTLPTSAIHYLVIARKF